MTHQEQHQTHVPGQRDGEHEDVAVGTARAPHREEPDGERYPAGTYASGSAGPDTAASHDDVDVVDRDTVLADDREDEARAGSVDVADGPDAIEQPVTEEVDSGESGSRPGSVDVAAVGAVWADGAVDGLRERWRELQLRFIDDPRAVAGEADALVGEAVGKITNALQAQRRELAAWQDHQGEDTERLRAAVRGYRDYLDRLLGM
ncbi:hypothetical protein [Dactylosporangium sp. CA-233914]|uniref:hypothetical protein n=1 Tax=Dactylosporangium sp. CA-233914 TaxID=3239934 RepID=UPI003D89BEDD